MQISLLLLGIIAYSLVLAYDLWKTYLSPRISSYEWFPKEPDLPPVAGKAKKKRTNRIYAFLFIYFLGILILIIGLLDYSPAQPACIPILRYIVAIFAVTATAMWYTDSKDMTVPYHSEIRFLLGGVSIVVALYLEACGQGLL